MTVGSDVLCTLHTPSAVMAWVRAELGWYHGIFPSLFRGGFFMFHKRGMTEYFLLEVI